MKLFQRKDYYETAAFTASSYAADTIVSWGRKFQTAMVQTVVDPKSGMMALDRGWEHNGSYIKLELPISIKRTYIDPATFEYKTGYCRLVIMRSSRQPRVIAPDNIGFTRGDPVTSWVKVWRPLNPTTDPINIKKNEAAYGGPIEDSTYFKPADDSVTFDEAAK